ncbi:hypothetical protein [Enterocloster sp.]|uniref:hypothetical protein n=1 Tax=Enterocloster sp. TaxID=2719315 RepID=UPI0039A0500B
MAYGSDMKEALYSAIYLEEAAKTFVLAIHGSRDTTVGSGGHSEGKRGWLDYGQWREYKDGFSIGVDFGSLSARAMAVDIKRKDFKGVRIWLSPRDYEGIPPTGRKLEPGTALQDPRLLMPGSSLFRICLRTRSLGQTKWWESVLILLSAP